MPPSYPKESKGTEEASPQPGAQSLHLPSDPRKASSAFQVELPSSHSLLAELVMQAGGSLGALGAVSLGSSL